MKGAPDLGSEAAPLSPSAAPQTEDEGAASVQPERRSAQLPGPGKQSEAQRDSQDVRSAGEGRKPKPATAARSDARSEAQPSVVIGPERRSAQLPGPGKQSEAQRDSQDVRSAGEGRKPKPATARSDARSEAQPSVVIGLAFETLIGLIDRTVLEPSRRIFVNRNTRMDQIKTIGFDMDYTLAPYLKRNIEELSFRLTVEKLIKKYGYPDRIRDLPYDPSFVVRGLVVDKRRGNIFKMDAHNHVGRVYHGRRPLSKEERRKLYRDQKIRLGSTKYHWIDTLFALPEAALYADIIDLLELQLGQTEIDYWKLFDHIRAAIDECHRDGSLKTIVKANPAHYIEVDPDLPHALHKLRSSGKRLFVLTNSLWDYTARVMSFLLDGKLPEYPQWHNYFDVIVVGSDKPAFFTEERPFYEVDRRSGVVASVKADRFERQHVYEGGCISRFEEILGLGGEQILYVGDHIYGDIIRSKKDTLWRTALIISELEDEMRLQPQLHHAQADLMDLEERREALEEEITTTRLKLSAIEVAMDDSPDRDADELEELNKLRKQLRLSFDRCRRDLKVVIERREALTGEVDRLFNPFWGSVFKEGQENSRFGRQVEYYACLYTSRVSNFLFYSPQQYFRAPRHWMAHEKL
jgi:5'-nucleotidase